jgi:hypothetical protein
VDIFLSPRGRKDRGIRSRYASEHVLEEALIQNTRGNQKACKSLCGDVGSFSIPQHMEVMIASGGADIIHIARPVYRGSVSAVKARTGREDVIQECIRCMQCYRQTTLGLLTAPSTLYQRERVVLMAPGAQQKTSDCGRRDCRMPAAITAAGRGHKVILVRNETAWRCSFV